MNFETLSRRKCTSTLEEYISLETKRSCMSMYVIERCNRATVLGHEKWMECWKLKETKRGKQLEVTDPPSL